MKRYPLGNYGLTMVLGTAFLIAWIAQTYFGWLEFASEARQAGQTAMLMGQDGYINRWMAATMENWQSEFLQLLSFVVLTSFLIHKGSHESKDTDDEMQEQLNRIEAELKALRAEREPQSFSLGGNGSIPGSQPPLTPASSR